MPEIRADWCEDEFGLAERAVDWVLETYGAPTDRTGVSESGRITIEYRDPRTETQRQALEFLQQRRIIAGSAEFIEQSFDLIDDIEIIVRSCGVPNGFWDPDYREMIFCYELLEAFAQLGNSPEVQGLSHLCAAARE